MSGGDLQRSLPLRVRPLRIAENTGLCRRTGPDRHDRSRAESIRMIAASDGDISARRCHIARVSASSVRLRCPTHRFREIDCPAKLRLTGGRSSPDAAGRAPRQLSWPDDQPNYADAETLSARHAVRRRGFDDPHAPPVRPVSAPPTGGITIGAVAPKLKERS